MDKQIIYEHKPILQEDEGYEYEALCQSLCLQLERLRAELDSIISDANYRVFSLQMLKRERVQEERRRESGAGKR